MVASVLMTAAGMALFLNVCDLAAGGHLAIAANDAATRESGEAEKPNETHHALRQIAEQYVCRARVRLSSEAHVSRIVTNAAKVHRKMARCEI